MFAAGVAVESIFRAYRCRIDPEFDARHDLYALGSAAGFMEIVPEHHRESYSSALSALYSRWSNKHRYRSDAAIRKFLKRANLDRDVRGDVLKENTRIAIAASTTIVSLGLLQWKNSSPG